MVKKNTKTPAARRTYIVGIGASAGGLEALEKLFRAMPVDSGMAFVVIRHLSPDFKSLMGEHLERYTTMPAISVMEREIIAPNTIYLLPPKKDMVIEGDELICTDRPDDKVLSLPINTFFRSLATAWGEKQWLSCCLGQDRMVVLALWMYTRAVDWYLRRVWTVLALMVCRAVR